MHLAFIWAGKTKNEHWAALEEEYLERLRRFARCQVRVLRGVKDNEPRSVEREGEAILQSLKSDAYVVLLDEKGAMVSSKELAEMINKRQMSGTSEMSFIIGSHHGVSDAVRRRANRMLSLSRMTLPHEMARVVVLEQVYRAFAIIHRLPYPK
jgi:23S rRNA (pseudouridine1915-N3)-methyltransferase